MKKYFAIMALICIFSGCIKDTDTGADIKIGDALPDFEVLMSDGSVVTGSSLRDGVSIVMFFHTTCPDCQQALPRMQSIYDEYVPEGVEIALISREDAADDVESYWSANGLDMPYSAQSDRVIYELFASSRIPRIYISDENGIVRYIFTDDPVPSYDDLKSALENVIR